MLVVRDPLHVDSSAEYVPPRHVPEADGSAQRILPMRLAKVHRRIVVDAKDLPEPAGDPQSDTGDSRSGSETANGCGSGSDALDGDATTIVLSR